MPEIVLLTGVSGFIGLHCAQQLVNAGYAVRGSVRSAAKEKEARKTLRDASVDTTNLSIVELDLTSDKGWDEAVSGCDYVMHVASPFTIANPQSEDEMIRPAVEGTLRVLHAAKESSVKRVILTSSTVAMMGEKKTGTFGPGDWTDPSSANISTYFKSKTLAEQAAWAFISDQSGETAVEMVSVNPGGVFGPPLGRDITGQTMRMVDQMLRGKMPMVPDISFPMVDVRDVAMLQVRAMTHPNVAGLRIIASKAEPRSFVEVAKILKNNGYRGPSTRIAPNLLLRIMAKFDRGAKGMVGMLGMNLGADNSQTRALFDWDPRPFEDSVVDAAAAVSAITR